MRLAKISRPLPVPFGIARSYRQVACFAYDDAAQLRRIRFGGWMIVRALHFKIDPAITPTSRIRRIAVPMRDAFDGYRDHAPRGAVRFFHVQRDRTNTACWRRRNPQ